MIEKIDTNQIQDFLEKPSPSQPSSGKNLPNNDVDVSLQIGAEPGPDTPWGISTFSDQHFPHVRGTIILNSEELASLYHFPAKITALAPAITPIEAKKGGPPPGLPIE